MSSFDQNITLIKARQHWNNLMSKFLFIPRPDAHALFVQLALCYGEQHRAYHTLKHIVSMLDMFEMEKHLVKDHSSVLFAIWFHDSIYDVRPHQDLTSETRSVIFAKESLEALKMPEALIERVCYLIGLTDHATNQFVALDQDSSIFLDLDLAILGADPDIFSQYESDVRVEYSWVPEDLYKKKRAEILEALLASGVFRTIYFEHRLGSQMRQNLSRSIKQLKG